MKQVLLFKSSSLENGSRMDRQCIENGPMKYRKLFPLFFFLFFLGVGNVRGADPSWTHTFSSTSAPTVTNNQVTVNSVTWDLSTTIGKGSPTMTSGNDNSVRAWKFGSGSNHYYSNITLSTNYFSSYKVKSVEIIGCGNAAKNINISVTQGTGGSAVTIGSATINQAYANNWQNNNNCIKTINTNKGNGGVLTISFSPTTCAFSLRQIKVTYEEVTAPCTATPTIGAASLNGSFFLPHLLVLLTVVKGIPYLHRANHVSCHTLYILRIYPVILANYGFCYLFTSFQRSFRFVFKCQAIALYCRILIV